MNIENRSIRNRIKSEIGKRYGKLTVVEYAGTKNKRAMWRCVCDCGLATTVSGQNLRKGKTTSCGCVKREFFNQTHSYSDSEPLYGVWEQMRSRCNNPNNPRYKTYGAKGVTVCEEWNDYGKFREWSFANGYKVSEKGTPRGQRMSIDRIDPDKPYCPENCRWITLIENIQHRHECHANQR